MSEYIKKEDLFAKTINKNKIWLHITNAEGKNLKEIVEDLPTFSVPEREKGTDLISREKALTELEAHKLPKQYCIDHNIDETIDMGMVRIILNQLPSAVLEREKGEWIKCCSCCREYKCSNCEYEHCQESNFCPNCGADMRGDKE